MNKLLLLLTLGYLQLATAKKKSSRKINACRVWIVLLAGTVSKDLKENT